MDQPQSLRSKSCTWFITTTTLTLALFNLPHLSACLQTLTYVILGSQWQLTYFVVCVWGCVGPGMTGVHIASYFCSENDMRYRVCPQQPENVSTDYLCRRIWTVGFQSVSDFFWDFRSEDCLIRSALKKHPRVLFLGLKQADCKYVNIWIFNMMWPTKCQILYNEQEISVYFGRCVACILFNAFFFIIISSEYFWIQYRTGSK